MGLHKLKVQVHLRAFIFSPEQKIRQQQHIKDKTYRRKMQYGRIKCRSMSRSKPHLVMDSWAHIIRRAGRIFKAQLCQDYCRRKVIKRQYYILSLYPKNFGYSLGGYSHREHCCAPDGNGLTKRKI
jgi:hypothetical protein